MGWRAVMPTGGPVRNTIFRLNGHAQHFTRPRRGVTHQRRRAEAPEADIACEVNRILWTDVPALRRNSRRHDGAGYLIQGVRRDPAEFGIVPGQQVEPVHSRLHTELLIHRGGGTLGSLHYVDFV